MKESQVKNPVFHAHGLEKVSSPFLVRCLEEEVFSLVDLYLGFSLLKRIQDIPNESLLCFFCYLGMTARNGHLCLKIEDHGIVPSPFAMTADPEIAEAIQQKLIEAYLCIPDSICRLVSPDEVFFDKPIGRLGSSFYLQKNWLWESKFLEHIERIQNTKPFLSIERPLELSPLLNQEQKKAIQNVFASPISLISGGPGTGKTFTAVEMIRTFLQLLAPEQRESCRIKVAAPTGKAASNLEKNIIKPFGILPQVECGTIHSIFQIKSSERLLNPGTSVYADLLIIDESSMLDARLFSYLLSSFRDGGRLVLIGDKNQLPPIDSGCFFADLLQLSSVLSIGSTELTQCLRVEKQEILDLSHAVYKGEVSTTFSLLKQEGQSEIRFHPQDSIPTSKEVIWARSQERFPSPSKQWPDPEVLLSTIDRFRILSCLRKGPLGIEALNQMILDRFLEEAEGNSFLACPILITENDYEMDLFNGEVGFLLAQVSSWKHQYFTNNDKAFFYHKENYPALREVSALLLPSFDLSYCMSVHKSQGSEYERVLAVVPAGSEVFGREVLYTAITRTKKEIEILSQEQVLERMIRKSSRKISGLHDRLTKKALS